MLNSKIPDQGMTYVDYFKQKGYGNSLNIDQVQQMYTHAINAAKQLNIAFLGPKDLKLFRNTRNSHRVGEYVLKKYGNEVQVKVVEEMLKGYFERAEDINDATVLAKCAAKAGLNEKEIEDFVKDPSSKPTKAEIEAQCHQIVDEYQVSGVPYFVINQQFALSGAQDPSAFIKIFEELKKKQ